MTSGRWKDIFEGIGLVAIIASLIFVGIETRNGAIQAELNTRAIELSAYQELIDSINRQSEFLIAQPELREAWGKARSRAFSELTPREQQLVGLYLFTRFRHGDMAYFQYQQGAISEARMISAVASVINLSRSQFAIDWWSRARDNFVPEYRDFIDQYFVETGANENSYPIDAK